MKKLCVVLILVILLSLGVRTFIETDEKDYSSSGNTGIVQNEVELNKEEINENGDVIQQETIGKGENNNHINNNSNKDDNNIDNNNSSANNTTNNNNGSTNNNNGSTNNTINNNNGSTNNTTNNNNSNTNNTTNNNNGSTNNTTTTQYGTIVINYIDEDGNKIAASTTDSKAKVGSTYKYNAPSMEGYIVENSSISTKINTKGEKKEVSFVYANQDYAPYISTYYIKPTVSTGEDVKIKFYVTDYFQKEYRNEDNSKTFKITLKVDGKSDITRTVSAGVHEISIGSFATTGNVDFSLIATDKFGRNSHELFNYFRVHNGTTRKEYVMTAADLQKYNIKATDTYAERRYVDVNEISNNIVSTMTEAFNKATVPSNKYVVLIPRNVNDNNQAGHALYKYVRVKYASDYDADKVMEESKNTRIGLQNFINDIQRQGYNYVKLINGIYRIDHEDSIYIPSNITVDLNGSTIKQNQFIGNSAYMISITNAYDAHLINGNIEGDYYEHDYTNSTNNSEWVSGIGINGISEYSSIENVNVRDITGYGVMTGMAKKDGYTFFYPISISGWEFKDINRSSGQEVSSNSRVTSGYVDLTKVNESGTKYISISKYLGYQGRIGNTWNLVVNFYDKNKNFIKSIDGYQYRRVKMPSNSQYIRVTVYEAKGLDPTIFNELKVTLFKQPTNSVIQNVLIDNARCVGMAPSQMNNMLFNNIEFTRNGQSGAFSAMDAEDGWDGMQDVTFRNLNFHHNHRNDFLTCAGHNFIVENMIQGNLHIYGRTNGFVYENNNLNKGASITVFAANRGRNGYYRLSNNTIGNVSLNSDGDNYLLNYNWPQLFKNSTILRRAGTAYKLDDNTKKFTHFSGKFINCVFESDSSVSDSWNNALGIAYYDRCTFNGASGENYGGYYINSTLNNVQGNLHNTTEIYNSTINGFKIYTGGYDPHIYINNSKITNLKISSGYWSRGAYSEITNNTIVNDDVLYYIPHYATGYAINIKNNNITLNNSVLKFYDDRDNGSTAYDRYPITITGNTIKSTVANKYVIEGLIGKTNVNNPLTFEIKNNKLTNLSNFEKDIKSNNKITIK